MKKFRTWYDTRIDEVEVIHETAMYVSVREMIANKPYEHSDAKRSEDGYNYFDTWAEAKAFLIDREQTTIRDLKRQIAYHEERLRKIEELQP